MSTSTARALDQQLTFDVERAAGGDSEAFARLVERTSSTVCAIAYAAVGNAAISEEIAQDVYLAVWRGLRKLNNPRSFLPWLRQLTRNHANSHLRRHYTRAGHRTVGEEAIAAAIDPRPDVAQTLEQRQEEEAVQLALQELPDESREVLVLYYREGRSSSQVAELLGISEGAVRKRMQRAREQLRQDVLRRLRLGIERTVPAATFVTAVVAAAAASSAPASATVVSAAAVRGAAAGGLKLGGLAGLAGALAGVVPGVLGVVLGLRQEFRDAIDERERRQLRNLQYAAVASVVTAGLGFVAAARAEHWLPPTAVYLSFLASLSLLYHVALPRIAARRMAHELATDPAAPARHRRRRLRSITGFFGGALAGGLGLFFGLWSSGLLG